MRQLALLPVIVVLLVGCDSDGGDGSTQGSASTAAATSTSAAADVRSGAVTVPIREYAYEPKTLVVKTGTKVTFVNEDTAPHTATAKDRSFDSGTLDEGGRKALTLNQAGTFAYFCEFHPYMKGTVRVVG